MSSVSFGQVPNWTETSCNTNSYTMHDELSAGNAVILDFGAVWCGPCQMTAPELEAVWQAFDQGNLGVKVFGFLIQDASIQNTDCADVAAWDQGLNLTYPGFADCMDIYTDYDTQYNGGGAIPLILVFVPDQNNPGQSTLVYNYITGLGASSGDISDDIMTVLADNGYWALDIEEQTIDTNKELVMIVDLMGRETTFKANTPLIYIYNDGSRERVLKVQ
ncbi:thioredoxin domain-containing protein [Crocinitomicaceae bacterium]|nr:thioredoxin domain-containing protein [Crocinitomicaceae bacterium]